LFCFGSGVVEKRRDRKVCDEDRAQETGFGIVVMDCRFRSTQRRRVVSRLDRMFLGYAHKLQDEESEGWDQAGRQEASKQAAWFGANTTGTTTRCVLEGCVGA
jgi:hypothetical protein